jgi:hypothetical protein
MKRISNKNIIDIIGIVYKNFLEFIPIKRQTAKKMQIAGLSCIFNEFEFYFM